jgi:hypothetical protein
MRDQQRRHARVVHPDADPVAGDPRLGHLEHGLADPVAVADAHLVICQAADREVLPELAVGEVITAQLLLPVPVRLDLVHEHGAVLAAVPGEVALLITVEVQPPRHHRAPGRPLPYRRVHSPAVPGHILRQAHIHRQQAASPAVSGHHVLHYSKAGPGDRAQPRAVTRALSALSLLLLGTPAREPGVTPRAHSRPA